MFELFSYFWVDLFGKGTKSERMTAFNNGLALAPQHDIAVGTISHPKLLSAADNSQEMAIPDKNAGLAGSDKDTAKFAIVNIHSCIAVKKIDITLLTVRDLKLLHVQRLRHLDQSLKPSIFEHKVFSA